MHGVVWCGFLLNILSLSSMSLLAHAFSTVASKQRLVSDRFLRKGLRSLSSFQLHKPQQVITAFPQQSRLFASAINSDGASVPVVDFYAYKGDDDNLDVGDYSLIASQSQEAAKKYVPVQDLNESLIGQKVWIRGRVSSVRSKGNACFTVIRGNSFYTVQACHFKDKAQADQSKKLVKFVGDLPLESIVDIYGEVVGASVKSCSQHTVEVHIRKVYTVSRAPTSLPFLLEDASRSQAQIDASEHSDRPLSGVAQDVRLNNRWLDLRVPANNAIMRLRSAISLLFRESLLNEQFIEINSPKLISGESEGGSEVFRTDYFGTPACLAQSPQLYKQMAVSGDLNRVFEIGPVFRAEKSNTRRHLCEFTGLDLEMAIDSHYTETLGGKPF